jgi:hypothetical protein
MDDVRTALIEEEARLYNAYVVVYREKGQAAAGMARETWYDAIVRCKAAGIDSNVLREYHQQRGAEAAARRRKA